MIPRQQNVVKGVALFLVFSISQFCVQLSLAAADLDSQSGASNTPQVAGKLETHGKRHIKVDDIETETGATIIDGATLETSECVSATVHLELLGLGEVELANNTIATVNYSKTENKVKVILKRGCVRIHVYQNIEGTIETPDGNSTPAVLPDTLDRKRAEVCFPKDEERDFRPYCAAVVGAVFWPYVLGGLGAGVIAALVLASPSSPCDRGSNPSNSTPTGPQCQ